MKDAWEAPNVFRVEESYGCKQCKQWAELGRMILIVILSLIGFCPNIILSPHTPSIPVKRWLATYTLASQFIYFTELQLLTSISQIARIVRKTHRQGAKDSMFVSGSPPCFQQTDDHLDSLHGIFSPSNLYIRLRTGAKRNRRNDIFPEQNLRAQIEQVDPSARHRNL